MGTLTLSSLVLDTYLTYTASRFSLHLIRLTFPSRRITLHHIDKVR